MLSPNVIPGPAIPGQNRGAPIGEHAMEHAERTRALRRASTPGPCAPAAARAPYQALLTGTFPDLVPVLLPGGARPSFTLAISERTADFARAGVVKDAGGDPDV